MRVLIASLLILLLANVAEAASGTASVDAATFSRLAGLPVGASIDIAEFPAGPGVLTRIRFKRIDVYARDARIFVVDAKGEHEVPRSPRIHLLGYSVDGSTRVGLSFDPGTGADAYAAGSGPAGAIVVQIRRQGDSWQFSAISAESALPPGVTLDYPENEDSLPNPNAPPQALNHLIGINQVAGGPQRYALIGVDTDTTFMAERFTGNTIQATAWIADLFAQMNLMYQRDLDVILEQGTTILRVASDPYPNADTSATGAMLDEFGTYWQNNYSSGGARITRAFAMLLSGNSNNPNGASGRAWVDAYCQTSGAGGGYSVNQIFTNSGIGVVFSASLVGHELGHNFGAAHTHCSNATTGSYPTATNTIDQCSNVGSGCYAGTTSCPVSGPGAPKGTVMSYCNQFSGGACGQNVLEFHPTHITQLRNRVAANTPSCLKTFSDVIFKNGFQ